MAIPVHITGMGIISAIGNNVQETASSLQASRTGIADLVHLETLHKNDFKAGEVKAGDADLSKLAGHYDRTTQLGMIAALQAADDAGIEKSPGTRTGFISSTTVAGMCYSEKFYTSFFAGVHNTPFIDSHFNGAHTLAIAAKLGIGGFTTSISTACSSSANAIMLGARLIRSGMLDRVIVGGVDALSKFTLNGFNTLMILDHEWCRPFDENRKGLNLGEGAAYLVLEREDRLKGRKSYGLLKGWANSNDAFHQTASSAEGEGAYLAMEKALQCAGLVPEKIHYINAHGTGTANNDASEGAAMQRVFGEKCPSFSSTKAYTGHTLAAAASIEAVISLISLNSGQIFPCLNRTQKMKDLSIEPVDKVLSNQSMQNVMSNSFGFGGNCSSLIFSSN